jgi:hypothetical protein
MHVVWSIVGVLTSFAASGAVFLVSGPVVRYLPLGKAHFPESFIKNVTYVEMGGWLFIILGLACLSGLVHGFAFRGRGVAAMTVATAIPAMLVWFMFMAASMGAAFFAFPVVMGYVAAFWVGARQGARAHTGFEATG